MQKAQFLLHSFVRIIRSLLGRDAAVIGAATLVIQEIFNGINRK